MKAEMNLENMKLLGILEMVERKLLETAYYHELGFGEIQTIIFSKVPKDKMEYIRDTMQGFVSDAVQFCVDLERWK